MLMLNLIIKMQIMDKHNNKRLLFFLKLKRQNLVDNKQQSQLDITFQVSFIQIQIYLEIQKNLTFYNRYYYKIEIFKYSTRFNNI